MRPKPIGEIAHDCERALVFGELVLSPDMFDPNDVTRDWHTADRPISIDDHWRADGEGYVLGVTHFLPIPPAPEV